MDAILETKNLTRAFGGNLAVNEVNLKVEPYCLKSIIGPNGAGKTTLFNLLSGQLKATRGNVFFKGTDITRLSPSSRTRLGIGRSFQITNVFPNLTVLENVRLSVQSSKGIFYQMFVHYKSYPELEKKSQHVLETVSLSAKSNTVARNLTHGEQRKLEIAMILALETEVLLLDEPTAGISLEEMPMILEAINLIKREGNRTIVLIEHKMDTVLSVSDSIMVMHNGRVLAEGDPSAIMNNEQVQIAYLGGLYDSAS